MTSMKMSRGAKNLSEWCICVKSATLDGKHLSDGKINHADIMRGGELVFQMHRRDD